ncbi:MAG TPA: hypothetical protein EYN51_06375 [Flavobacteriales bacterium]|nr:hypothetical protein [Flavobacteriales bacterium]
MAVTLVLEDGTGIDDANTYQLVADFRTYFDNLGIDTSALLDAAVTAALFETGSCLLEICFTYKGLISFPETPQALSWPRTGLRDRRGLEVPADSIPNEIKKAQNELARTVALQAADGGRYSYSDSPTNTGAEKRNKLDVLEEEFYGPGTAFTIEISKDVQSFISKILRPYITGGNAFHVTNVAVI